MCIRDSDWIVATCANDQLRGYAGRAEFPETRAIQFCLAIHHHGQWRLPYSQPLDFDVLGCEINCTAREGKCLAVNASAIDRAKLQTLKLPPDLRFKCQRIAQNGFPRLSILYRIFSTELMKRQNPFHVGTRLPV